MSIETKWLALALGLMVGGCEGGSLGVETPAGSGFADPPVGGANNRPIAEGEIDPGRITIHRLNRAEYNNTVRDLLGDATRPALAFPEDDFGYGFNNIADVLSVSPLHVESYFNAAEALVDAALDRGAPASTTTRVEAEAAGGSVGAVSGEVWVLWSNGTITQVVNVPARGEYRLRVRAWETAAGGEASKMAVSVNGQVVQTFDVSATENSPGMYEVTTTLEGGGQSIAVEFLNDYYDANLPADRNLLVDYFEVEGPLGVTSGAAATRAEIIPCDLEGAAAEACAREVITSFGRRAWRRPLVEAEVDGLMGLVGVALAEGDDVETGLRLALRAMLVSPHFLYRVEVDADPADPTPRRITDHELASRLSYFLWSSMPDEELLALADAGQLQDDAVLAAQVARMLDDPKAMALVDNFAAQWLYIDAVLHASPDDLVYPEFSAELAADMREESRLFFKALLDSNAPVADLVQAEYTYLNARLAQHYDVAGITGEGFVRHAWGDDSRRGILGHGSLLTATSHSTTTSPVLRGKWVLENLWCDAPPPAPPNVTPLDPAPVTGTTLRERLEQHAVDPTCNSCHRVMDPIGFGMENFDGVGAWRETDNGLPVDSSGELPGDLSFNGPRELSDILAASPKLPYCVTEKTLTYALGRGVEDWDRPQIDAIVRQTTEGGFRFRDMMTAIVLSDAFRMRRGGDL